MYTKLSTRPDPRTDPTRGQLWAKVGLNPAPGAMQWCGVLTAGAASRLAVAQPEDESLARVRRVDGVHGGGARRADEARLEAGAGRQLDGRRDRRTLVVERRHAVLVEALSRHPAVVACLHRACAVPELSMGWDDPLVALGRVGSRFFSFSWVGLGPL